MKISDLKPGQRQVNLTGKIIRVGKPKEFIRFGRTLRVADCLIEDFSGAMRLALWNQEIERFKEGDKVKISNGYVSEYNGEKQISSGKFGKIEIDEEKEGPACKIADYSS